MQKQKPTVRPPYECRECGKVCFKEEDRKHFPFCPRCVNGPIGDPFGAGSLTQRQREKKQ